MNTLEQAQARIAELEAVLAAQASGISIGTKGGIVVAVPGRWPVTLKGTEWTALLAKSDAIKAFVKANPGH